nr:hypothetical protein CFP56_08169 [Quercus suber]
MSWNCKWIVRICRKQVLQELIIVPSYGKDVTGKQVKIGHHCSCPIRVCGWSDQPRRNNFLESESKSVC